MIEKHPIFQERIAHKIKINKEGCWVWQGYTCSNGYGIVGGKIFCKKKVKLYKVHRLVMSLIHEIPKEMVIDHVCRNRSCCNPNHLRIVTIKQNILENSECHAALNASKTHCKNGHEFTKDNTYVYFTKRKIGKGYTRRICRICQIIASSARYRRVKNHA